MSDKIRVRVPLVIEVDPVAWAEREGIDTDQPRPMLVAEVRQDVRDYFLNHVVRATAVLEETGGTATLSKT